MSLLALFVVKLADQLRDDSTSISRYWPSIHSDKEIRRMEQECRTVAGWIIAKGC